MNSNNTSRWWGFAPYVVVSLIHVIALGADAAAIAGPTKLLLMPLLAAGAFNLLRGIRWSTAASLLLAAIVCSWIGDGAGTFFPFLEDELPAMLLFFGLAHVAYIVLFAKNLTTRGLPKWTPIYGAWWLVFLGILWPYLGALAIPVALYGIILGATATFAARCIPAIAIGGAFFLASDTILALRLFIEGMPPLLSPLVMLTYTLGQGLIVAGAVAELRRRSPATSHADAKIEA